MNKLQKIVFAIIVCPALVLAQTNRQKRQFSDEGFRLKKWYPYVYLEVHHVGPRKPENDAESRYGIWLYLHNNCRESIIVRTFGTSRDSDPKEIGVLDDVVPNSDETGAEQTAQGSQWPTELVMPALPSIPGTVSSGKQTAKGESVPQEKATIMPHGYMFPVSSSVTIKPGHSIYFSLPLNHVSMKWHFEIPFRFALEHNGPFREPDSYIAFFWEDLPESYRKAHDVN